MRPVRIACAAAVLALAAGCSAHPSAVLLSPPTTPGTPVTCQQRARLAHPDLTPDQVAAVCDTASAPSVPPTAAPVNAPSPASGPADIAVQCKVMDGTGGPGSAPVYFVGLSTSTFINVPEIIITVIGFAGGQEEDTGTVTFPGPFAGGQNFVNDATATAYAGDTSCEIASVSSDPPVTYDNLSPVPGGAS